MSVVAAIVVAFIAFGAGSKLAVVASVIANLTLLPFAPSITRLNNPVYQMLWKTMRRNDWQMRLIKLQSIVGMCLAALIYMAVYAAFVVLVVWLNRHYFMDPYPHGTHWPFWIEALLVALVPFDLEAGYSRSQQLNGVKTSNFNLGLTRYLAYVSIFTYIVCIFVKM